MSNNLKNIGDIQIFVIYSGTAVRRVGVRLLIGRNPQTIQIFYVLLESNGNFYLRSLCGSRIDGTEYEFAIRFINYYRDFFRTCSDKDIDRTLPALTDCQNAKNVSTLIKLL